MALNFPINPTVGQFYTAEGGTWVWNGTQWTGTAETSIIASDTPPPNPIGGTLWYKTSASVGLYFWFVDPDSSQWIDVGNGSSLTPTEGDTRYLRLIGGTMTGPINLPAPTAPEHAANMAYVDSVAAGGGGGVSFLPLTGGTLSGPLMLPAADPVDPAEAAHKAYVDAAVAAGGGGGGGITEAEADLRYLKLAGGALTGNLSIANADPKLFFGTAANASKFAIIGSANALYIFATSDAGEVVNIPFQIERDAAGITDASVAMSDPAIAMGQYSLVNRERGDARYLQLSQPNIMTGGARIEAPASGAFVYGFTGGGGLAMQGPNLAIQATDGATGSLVYGGAGGPATAFAPMVILSRQMGDSRYVQLAGGAMTGALLLPAGMPTDPQHAASKAYVDSVGGGGGGGGGLPLTGGTLTGPLYLPATTPVGATEAVTKAYVDATFFPLAGGTVTTGFTSSNTQPHFTLYETDAGTNLKSWRIWSVAGKLDIHPRSDANGTGTGSLTLTRSAFTVTDALLTGGLVAPTADSLMTRARGDLRYLTVTGGTVSGNFYLYGNLTVTPVDAGSEPYHAFRRFGAAISATMLAERVSDNFVLNKVLADGTTVATSIRLTEADVLLGGTALTATPVAASILTKARGDGLYAPKVLLDDLVATIAALTARVAELEGAR